MRQLLSEIPGAIQKPIESIEFVVLHLRSSFIFLFCVACSPVVDSPGLDLAQCSGGGGSAEIARFPYDANSDYETFDLVDGVTVAIDPGDGDAVAHYLVDNCGGAPLRLARTFGYRPGAAYVGGKVVLCSGGLGAPEGVWEVLDDGSAGEELGVGKGCPDRLRSHQNSVALSSMGVVWDGERFVQYFESGGTRSFPLGVFFRAGDAFVIESEGAVLVLPPGEAEPIGLELPEPVVGVVPARGDSTWTILYPDPDGRVMPIYAVNAETGTLLRTSPVVLDHNHDFWSVRDGLSAVFAFEGFLSFSRTSWDEPLVAREGPELRALTGLTVVDDEHVYLREGEDLWLIRVPKEFPAEGEPAFEVIWTRSVVHHDSPPRGVGTPWKKVILEATDGEIWAYPIDGSEPYPFLPRADSSLSYYGDEYVTVLGQRRDIESETLSLYRNSLDGEFEVVDENILDFQSRPWSPELGRIIYSVRAGDEVSVRQHRLPD